MVPCNVRNTDHLLNNISIHIRLENARDKQRKKFNIRRPLLTSIGEIPGKGLLNGDVELFPLHVPSIFEADVDSDVVE